MQEDIPIDPYPVIITFIGTAAALILVGYFTLKRRLVLAAVCLGCFFALFRPSVAMAEQCKPTRYADGDTFTFIRDGEKVRVRLAG